MKYYKLDENKNPVPCTLEEFGELYKDSEQHRIVKQTRLPGDILVSTVFLGLDHKFYSDDGPPILFETMIFGGEHDQYQERYTTWHDAWIGHHKAIELIFEIST